jgi:hypothetical protein
MVNYSRGVPPDASADLLQQVEDQVRQHISSVITPDDSPTARAADVRITRRTSEHEIVVCGRVDADPVANYLHPDFDPATEAASNPLTVTSVDDDPSVLHAASREED